MIVENCANDRNLAWQTNDILSEKKYQVIFVQISNKIQKYEFDINAQHSFNYKEKLWVVS